MVMSKEYIDHLNEKWCKLMIAVIKKMKEEFYLLWHFKMEHMTDFSRRLNKDQERLSDNNIVISNEDKTQHFMEQMNALGMFVIHQMRI